MKKGQVQTRHSIVDANWHEYVDLGLPSGNLWATCNVGASSPKEDGLFFMWGIRVGFDTNCTVPLNRDKWANSFERKEIIRMGVSALPAKFDMAHSKMGGSWVLPSSNDFAELTKAVSYDGTSDNIVQFASKYNGQKISFPLPGYADFASVNGRNEAAYLWGCDMNSVHDPITLAISRNGNISVSSYNGHFGHSVRGVIHASKDCHIIRKPNHQP